MLPKPVPDFFFFSSWCRFTSSSLKQEKPRREHGYRDNKSRVCLLGSVLMEWGQMRNKTENKWERVDRNQSKWERLSRKEREMNMCVCVCVCVCVCGGGDPVPFTNPDQPPRLHGRCVFSQTEGAAHSWTSLPDWFPRKISSQVNKRAGCFK